MKKKLTLLATAALIPLGLAAPAGAADPVYPLGSYPASVSLPPVTESGEVMGSLLTVGYFSSPSWQGKPVTFTIDTSEIAAFASVENEKCTSAATTLTCVTPESNLDLKLTARKGSKVGDLGELAVTAKTEGATFTPYKVPVQVGGPKLALDAQARMPAIKAIGDQGRIPLSFKNTGRIATDGAVVRMHVRRGTDLLEKYDNCTYGPAEAQYLGKGVTLITCTFEGPIEGGKAYEPAEPLTVKANGRAMNERLDLQVFRVNEAPKAPQGHTRPNTGKKLTLKPRTAPGGVYEDPSWDSQWSVPNTADFAAIGATATAKAGDTVKLDVGFHNRGPAAVTMDLRESAVSGDVRMPPGTTVTKVPEGCTEKYQNNKEYFCSGGISMLEDEKVLRTFEVRVDEVIPDAKGSIKVGSNQGGTQPEKWDPDHSNNKAAIVLNPKNTSPSPSPTATTSATPTGTATPSGTATPTASASASATAASGGLASTGSSALATAVGAAAVLAAGTVLFVVFRRRRGNHA
ncbi:hypothetical protein [Streptomyces sp. NPDC059656]|uniref:hypothetical protein n=1 Tax=Streptomyces sp. NPDC059656 TaxID=3346898 RepID=UPI00367E71CB